MADTEAANVGQHVGELLGRAHSEPAPPKPYVPPQCDGASQSDASEAANDPADSTGKVQLYRTDVEPVRSAGSANHETGGCKPCLFVHTIVGCQNGEKCEFCHLLHNRKNRPRPCKAKRDRLRKLLFRTAGVDDPRATSNNDDNDSISGDEGADKGERTSNDLKRGAPGDGGKESQSKKRRKKAKSKAAGNSKKSPDAESDSGDERPKSLRWSPTCRYCGSTVPKDLGCFICKMCGGRDFDAAVKSQHDPAPPNAHAVPAYVVPQFGMAMVPSVPPRHLAQPTSATPV